eukprot:CAMPEP_0119322662 /NCGR_PEP_ID=MMETSP1333-20130426/58795_1 /TAXON_ID=418940 /ORGANISM="Scyphosphaera apsteinii, Strain RCC1455" /LENGTH=289 /DNA_ID=CAMNT_0007329939 /DNA_START=18 /DNA_END=887 /DNA_ORIENTATION=+
MARLFPGRMGAAAKFARTAMRNGSALAELEPLGEVAKAARVLRMCKPPVNSLTLEMLEQLSDLITAADSDPDCRAVILASGCPGIFTAGLDIEEMHHPDPDRLWEFWTAVQEVWIRLSSSRVATVAAIEGHSPAGGCLLSISCDWRVMSTGQPGSRKPFLIGLNETKLGIVAPFWFAETFVSLVGLRQADYMLQTGALINAEHAARVGLIDEACAHEEVMDRAVARLTEFLSVSDAARHASKMLTRKPMIDRLLAHREEDSRWFTKFILTAPVQASLTEYLQALKKRKM